MICETAGDGMPLQDCVDAPDGSGCSKNTESGKSDEPSTPSTEGERRVVLIVFKGGNADGQCLWDVSRVRFWFWVLSQFGVVERIRLFNKHGNKQFFVQLYSTQDAKSVYRGLNGRLICGYLLVVIMSHKHEIALEKYRCWEFTRENAALREGTLRSPFNRLWVIQDLANLGSVGDCVYISGLLPVEHGSEQDLPPPEIQADGKPASPHRTVYITRRALEVFASQYGDVVGAVYARLSHDLPECALTQFTSCDAAGVFLENVGSFSFAIGVYTFRLTAAQSSKTNCARNESRVGQTASRVCASPSRTVAVRTTKESSVTRRREALENVFDVPPDGLRDYEAQMRGLHDELLDRLPELGAVTAQCSDGRLVERMYFHGGAGLPAVEFTSMGAAFLFLTRVGQKLGVQYAVDGEHQDTPRSLLYDSEHSLVVGLNRVFAEVESSQLPIWSDSDEVAKPAEDIVHNLEEDTYDYEAAWAAYEEASAEEARRLAEEVETKPGRKSRRTRNRMHRILESRLGACDDAFATVPSGNAPILPDTTSSAAPGGFSGEVPLLPTAPISDSQATVESEDAPPTLNPSIWTVNSKGW